MNCHDTDAVNQFGQAVDKLFEPAQQCRERLAEIAKASESLSQLAGAAFDLFESLKDFRDHMRKLSNSFVSMRTFQNDLGVLAESFEPVGALHHEVVRLADAVRIRLGQVVRSLEPANALRADAAELAQILENATELQAQFYDLSKTFGPVIHATGTGVKGERDETA